MSGTLWDTVDDRTLGEEDFQEVRNSVSSLAGLWASFGAALGLPAAAIKEIQLMYNDPSRCLDEVLDRWLKQNYNLMKFSPPSWRILVCAVSDRSGGKNPALAKKIAPNHTKGSQSSSPKQQLLPQPFLPEHQVVPPLPAPRGRISLHTTQLHDSVLTAPVQPLEDNCPSLMHITSSPSSSLEMQLQKGCTSESFVPIKPASQETLPPLSEKSVYYSSLQTREENGIGAEVALENGYHDPKPDNIGFGHQSLCHQDATVLPNRLPSCQESQFEPIDQALFPQFPKKTVDVDVDGGKCRYEQLNPLNPDVNELKLSFGVFQPKMLDPDGRFESYNMNSFPHGIALIINNEIFERQKFREGTDVDERNLIQTFRYLGYIVEVYRDQKKQEIEAIFDEIKGKDHSKFDSFVCCLLTHGADGGFIYGSDSQKVDLNNLTEKLNASNCQSLFGKPKMFFIQACRGKGKALGVKVDLTNMQVQPIVECDSDPVVLPSETDFFFGYATTPNMVAWRDLDHGSWYVNELCQALGEHSSYADLTSIHEIVQHNIAMKYEIDRYKQTTENNSRLTKKVYFSCSGNK